MKAINIMWVGVTVFALMLLLHIKITLKPFSITFDNWRYVLGIILIFVGVEILRYDAVAKYKRKLLKQ